MSSYFGNYLRLHGLHAEAAGIEGHAGLWIDEGGLAASRYAVVLEGDPSGRLAGIRDFRYERYVADALVG